MDVFYDSDGAGPCTQAPWDAFSSPREDELPDGSDCSEGGDAFPASPPGVASQAAFEGAEGLSDGGQLDETVSAADKRACELASLAESPEIGAAAGFRASSDEGCSINGTPPEMRRTGELDKQPGTQMVTPTEHLLEVERCIAQSVERVGAQDLPETPLLSSGVQDGAGATSALGEEEEPLCAELPTGELPLDSKRVGRRCGESLDGTIVAVSPIIEIGTASKPGHERTSFFLLELQLLESTAVSHRAAGQVATIGGACCAPGAQSRTGLPVQPLALGFCPPTSAEGILMPEPDQPTALISASRPAFVYIEGAARSKWREMCVAHAGQSVRVTGLKWRTMVVGSEGRERLVYVPGSDFGMDSGGRKGTVSGQSGGAECKGAEAANCGGECSSRGGGARHAAKGEGREGDNQHWGTWKGEERPPRKENALPSKQRDWRCGGGPSDGRQASDVREPMKGLPHDGTLCYVGVVSAVWSSGLVIELDRKLNLLLTHYPVTELPGLRVGSLLATWHVHPIPRGNRVLALGACTHSLVTVLGSPNPTGSETGLAGRGHLLRQLCDRLPFSVALWVVELERSLQVKLGGDSYRSKPAAAERVPSRLRSDVVGVEGPGKSRDGLRSLTEEEAARSKAPETAPVAVALRKGKAATSLKPSLQSLTGGPGELSPAGDSEGVSAPRTFPKGGNDCLSLVRDVLVHLLPGWKDLRQRRDVFGEFMSHDAECKLGVDPVGWKNPPKVPSIAALVGEVRKQGREPGRKVGQLSVDELGAALLGYLKVRVLLVLSLVPTFLSDFPTVPPFLLPDERLPLSSVVVSGFISFIVGGIA